MNMKKNKIALSPTKDEQKPNTLDFVECTNCNKSYNVEYIRKVRITFIKGTDGIIYSRNEFWCLECIKEVSDIDNQKTDTNDTKLKGGENNGRSRKDKMGRNAKKRIKYKDEEQTETVTEKTHFKGNEKTVQEHKLKGDKNEKNKSIRHT